MEVKKGYKQTEIGVIPTDWEVKRLGELGKFSKGQGIRKDEAQSGDIPCIRYGEIYTKHENVIKVFYSFISPSVAKTVKKIKQGDILFAGSGETKEEIGKCVANLISEEAYAGGDIVILSPLNADSLLLGYLLNSPPIAKQKSSKGQGDAVVHISAKGLKGVVIPLPKTKSEQSAIAAVLSETDILITNVEKLIAKKEAIKKGTMQVLLTGKKRLSGFQGKWQTKKLGIIAEIQKGQLITETEAGQGFIPVIAGGVKPSYFHSKSNRPTNTITISASGANAGFVAIHKYPIFASDCSTIVKDKNYNTDFLFFSLKEKQIEITKLQTGGAQPHVYPEHLKRLTLSIPEEIEEQEEIAKVLIEMTGEINHLQEKLEKYKVIKQGLMQNLLTGKIRLV